MDNVRYGPEKTVLRHLSKVHYATIKTAILEKCDCSVWYKYFGRDNEKMYY